MKHRHFNPFAVNRAPYPAANRRGAVLMLALVCISVMTILFASLLKLATSERRRMRDERHRLQAAWLVEAGIERAGHRLAGDPGYTGEKWDVASDELPGRHAGRVLIQIETADGGLGERTVAVEAVYPLRDTNFAKRTKHVIISVSPRP